MVDEARKGQGFPQGENFAGLVSIRPNSLLELVDYYHALAEGLEKEYLLQNIRNWSRGRLKEGGLVSEREWATAIELLNLDDVDIADSWLRRLHELWWAEGGFNLKPWAHQALIATLQRLPHACPDALTAGGATAFMREILSWIRGAQYLTGSIEAPEAWDAVIEVIQVLSTYYQTGVGSALFDDFFRLQQTFAFNLKQLKESQNEAEAFYQQIQQQLADAPETIADLKKKSAKASEKRNAAISHRQSAAQDMQVAAELRESGGFNQLKGFARGKYAKRQTKKQEQRGIKYQEEIHKYAQQLETLQKDLPSKLDAAQKDAAHLATRLTRYKQLGEALVASRAVLKIDGTRQQDWETKTQLFTTCMDTVAQGVDAVTAPVEGIAGLVGATATSAATGGLSTALGIGSASIGLGSSLKSAISSGVGAVTSGASAALQAYYLLRDADEHPGKLLFGSKEFGEGKSEVQGLLPIVHERYLHSVSKRLKTDIKAKQCLLLVQSLQGFLIGANVATMVVGDERRLAAKQMAEVLRAMFKRFACSKHPDKTLCTEIIMLNQGLMRLGWPMLGEHSIHDTPAGESQAVIAAYQAAYERTHIPDDEIRASGKGFYVSWFSDEKRAQGVQVLVDSLASCLQRLADAPPVNTLPLCPQPWETWYQADGKVQNLDALLNPPETALLLPTDEDIAQVASELRVALVTATKALTEGQASSLSFFAMQHALALLEDPRLQAILQKFPQAVSVTLPNYDEDIHVLRQLLINMTTEMDKQKQVQIQQLPETVIYDGGSIIGTTFNSLIAVIGQEGRNTYGFKNTDMRDTTFNAPIMTTNPVVQDSLKELKNLVARYADEMKKYDMLYMEAIEKDDEQAERKYDKLHERSSARYYEAREKLQKAEAEHNKQFLASSNPSPHTQSNVSSNPSSLFHSQRSSKPVVPRVNSSRVESVKEEKQEMPETPDELDVCPSWLIIDDDTKQLTIDDNAVTMEEEALLGAIQEKITNFLNDIGRRARKQVPIIRNEGKEVTQVTCPTEELFKRLLAKLGVMAPKPMPQL